MDNVDKTVNAEQLKKKLTDYKNFIQNIEEFRKEIEKYGKKVPISKLDPMKNYIAFEQVEGYDYTEHHNIILYEGNHHDDRWREFFIWSAYPGKDTTKFEHIRQKIDLRIGVYEKRYNVGKRRYGIYKYKYVYALPPQYDWMFDWIKKKNGIYE